MTMSMSAAKAGVLLSQCSCSNVPRLNRLSQQLRRLFTQSRHLRSKAPPKPPPSAAVPTLADEIKVLSAKVRRLRLSARRPPKPAVSGVTVFLREKAAMTSSAPGLGSSSNKPSHRDSYRQGHSEWAALPEEERARFEAAAASNRAEYEASLDRWKERMSEDKMRELEEAEGELDFIRRHAAEMRRAAKTVKAADRQSSSSSDKT